eukprot:6233796-Amphidinium_carterae.1
MSCGNSFMIISTGSDSMNRIKVIIIDTEEAEVDKTPARLLSPFKRSTKHKNYLKDTKMKLKDDVRMLIAVGHNFALDSMHWSQLDQLWTHQSRSSNRVGLPNI